MKQSVSEDDHKNHLMETLAYELPVLCARLGISQAELAKRVGISRQTYNNIETGKKRINWLTFNALMAVFKSNEGTKSMLEKLDGFESEVLIALGSTVE
jgi:hypothetical protein